ALLRPAPREVEQLVGLVRDREGEGQLLQRVRGGCGVGQGGAQPQQPRGQQLDLEVDGETLLLVGQCEAHRRRPGLRVRRGQGPAVELEPDGHQPRGPSGAVGPAPPSPGRPIQPSDCWGSRPIRTGTSTALWGTASTAASHTASRPAGPRSPSGAPQWTTAGSRPSVTSSTTETPSACRCTRWVAPGRGAVTVVSTGIRRGDIDGLQDWVLPAGEGGVALGITESMKIICSRQGPS